MEVFQISHNTDIKKLLQDVGVDSGAIKILSSKMQHYFIKIDHLHFAGANILKQDALSIGADLAVPRDTIMGSVKFVNCVLIGTKKHLEILSKKELSQPFGLAEVAKVLKKIVGVKRDYCVDVMGVINANDDSFFSNSRFVGNSAIGKIEQMIDDGANIIDIGAVSSRPNAPVVDVEDELVRVKDIVDALYENKIYDSVKLSIDSYQPKVLSYVLERGFSIVNDITGLQNEEVIKLCASYNATAVVMHMQGTPQTMQNNPIYNNVLTDLYYYFSHTIQKAESLGVNDIVLDVGIGFGKTLEHNISLIKNLEYFLTLEKRLLVGASRKSMIDQIFPSPVEDRLAGTLALHLEAFRNGASILRVHDVKEHVQALSIQKAFI